MESGGTTAVADNLRQRAARADRIGGTYRSIAEAMPNVRYLVDGRREVRIADLYVVGTVADVEAGKAFRYQPVGGEDESTAVSYNSKEAQVGTIHLVVDVQRSITDGKTPEPSGQVRIGLALDSPIDVEAARREFEGYGTLAFLLYRPSPVLDYGPDLWAVLEDGSFFAVVEESGTVEFLALDPVAAPALAPRGLTVSDLEQPDSDEPIELKTVNGELVRP